MLKKCVILLYFLPLGLAASAQKPDSIYFNLYTDSLKKGTYNYINVEGRFSDGRYLPLGPKEVKFSSSAGKFDGNSLFIDTSYKKESVTVKVVANGNPSMWKEITIYIKKMENTERLPTVDEIMNQPSSDPGSTKNRRNRRRG